MAFELPSLPYDYEALQPYMSKETLEFHHDKHHKAYVDNGNKLAAEAGMDKLSLEEIVKQSFGKNPGLFNNAGQHYNHIHFWKWMKKGGGGNKLPGALQKAVDSDLGGYDKFKADFIAAGTTQFGSGWAWLSVKDGKLAISKTPNGENPLVHGAHADPRRRCLGALLLHRLSQRAAEISRGLRRQPDQLGLRAGAVRSGQTLTCEHRLLHKTPAFAGVFLLRASLLRGAESSRRREAKPELFRPPSSLAQMRQHARPPTGGQFMRKLILAISTARARGIGRLCRSDRRSQGHHEGARRAWSADWPRWPRARRLSMPQRC